MGWQRWLSLGATSVQPIPSLNGLMATKHTKALELTNASNAAPWALKMKLRLSILRNLSCAARNADHGCLQIRSVLHVRFSQ